MSSERPLILVIETALGLPLAKLPGPVKGHLTSNQFRAVLDYCKPYWQAILQWWAAHYDEPMDDFIAESSKCLPTRRGAEVVEPLWALLVVHGVPTMDARRLADLEQRLRKAAPRADHTLVNEHLMVRIEAHGETPERPLLPLGWGLACFKAEHVPG